MKLNIKSMLNKAVLLLLLVTLVACGGSQKGGKLKIGLSMESLESQFLVMNHEAMVNKAKELDIELIVLIAEGDASKQNQQIENLISSGVKSIVIFPKDGASIASAVKKAQDAGVNVVMNNRAIQSDTVVPELEVLADNRQMAYSLVKDYGEKMRATSTKHKVILLVGNLTDSGAVERQIGHKKALEEYSDVFELVAEIPTEWDHDLALKGLQNSLQANPDASLLITPSDFLYPPMRSALEQANRWAKIGDPNHMSILSFDGDEVGMQYVKDGYAEGNAAQNPIFEGETSIEWAVKLAEGTKPSELVIYDNGIIVTEDNFEEVGPDVWSWGLLK